MDEPVSREEFEKFKAEVNGAANHLLLAMGNLAAIGNAVEVLIATHPNPQAAFDALFARLNPDTAPRIGDLRDQGWNNGSAQLLAAATTALAAHQARTERKN
jgi:hypothetical protein